MLCTHPWSLVTVYVLKSGHVLKLFCIILLCSMARHSTTTKKPNLSYSSFIFNMPSSLCRCSACVLPSYDLSPLPYVIVNKWTTLWFTIVARALFCSALITSVFRSRSPQITSTDADSQTKLLCRWTQRRQRGVVFLWVILRCVCVWRQECQRVPCDAPAAGQIAADTTPGAHRVMYCSLRSPFVSVRWVGTERGFPISMESAGHIILPTRQSCIWLL